MSSRHKDWLNQAKRDLTHAKNACDDKDYEWACFAAQQAAEKAVKALYQKLGADAWGHSVYALLENLPGEFEPFIEELKENAKELDKHYIPTRYPNSYAQGAPFEYYTEREAKRAIEYATQIISFCEDKIFG